MKIKYLSIFIFLFIGIFSFPTETFAVGAVHSQSEKAIDLLELDVKTFRKPNGKKLNFVEKFLIKRIQKRARKRQARLGGEDEFHNHGADAFFFTMGALGLMIVVGLAASFVVQDIESIAAVGVIMAFIFGLIGFAKSFTAFKHMKKDPEKKGLAMAIVSVIVGGLFAIWALSLLALVLLVF